MDALINTFTNITFNDVLDILIVAFIFYQILMLVKETRAETLLKGVLIILIVWKISEWAQLRLLQFLIRNMMTLGLVAMIIVFQPELRRALEYLGKNKFMQKSIIDKELDEADREIREIVDAVTIMASTKTGALIVFEREIGLNEVSSTGTELDAKISSEVIRNIFFKNSPLHDGAMLVKKGRIKAASCILPLTQSTNISSDLGTRHRAALGIVEKSDALVIVVSEENGVISMCHDGTLSRYLDSNSLASILRSKLKVQKKNQNFLTFLRRSRDERDE